MRSRLATSFVNEEANKIENSREEGGELVAVLNGILQNKIGEFGQERNKFKKVKMSIFNGNDPDSLLFGAKRYFQVHKLNETEKMIVAMISGVGLASSGGTRSVS